MNFFLFSYINLRVVFFNLIKQTHSLKCENKKKYFGEQWCWARVTGEEIRQKTEKQDSFMTQKKYFIDVKTCMIPPLFRSICHYILIITVKTLTSNIFKWPDYY